MKRRLKRPIKYILIIVSIIIAVLFIYKIINENNKVDYVKEDIVDIIYNKLGNIDKDFLKWVNDNYEDSLKNMNTILENNSYNEAMWHEVTGNSYIVLNDLYKKTYENMNNVKILNSNEKSILSFVGDVSLADNWYIIPKYESRNEGVLGILSEEVVDIMTSSDLMVANSEFTVSNRGIPLEGKSYTFRAKPERLSIYKEMGVDLVTLANNHVYDYGRDAFLDMLDAFDEYEIPRIGAGKNYEEAKMPYYFIINGYKIAFINGTRAEKNIKTPEATSTSPGVFRCYDTTNMVNEIKSIKENSDYVIAIIHYGKEYSHELEKEQIDSSKEYIDAGADIVIGHHAHLLQGIEFYNGKPIIYNLGNFIFNEETLDTAIFQIVLNNDGVLEYYIIPALQKNEYTELLKDSEKERVINDLNSWSINAYINQDGKITSKT